MIVGIKMFYTFARFFILVGIGLFFMYLIKYK